MTRAQARETAREILEIIPLVMRTVAAELRAAGEMPAPAHFACSRSSASGRASSPTSRRRRASACRRMSNSISAMAERGWVRRAAPDGDRRIAMIELTATGRAALERVSRCAEGHLSEVLAPLDVPARRRLRGGLGILRKVFAASPASLATESSSNTSEAKVVSILDRQSEARMAQTMTAAATATRGKSLPARFAGVIFSPRATYADVAARPRVLGMLALVMAIIVAATFVFLSTEVGQQASLDNQVRQMEAFGRTVSDAQYAQMERMAPYARYFAAVFQFVSMPIMAFVVAAIALGVFNAGFGGDATLKQVYAIVVHSGVSPRRPGVFRPAACLRARDARRARRTWRCSFRFSTTRPSRPEPSALSTWCSSGGW